MHSSVQRSAEKKSRYIASVVLVEKGSKSSAASCSAVAGSSSSPPRAKGSGVFMLHPPLGRVRVIVVIVLAPHRSQFAPLQLLAPLLLGKLVVEPAVDPSRHVGQGARLVVGVALVIDRLIGDCADKPIGGQDAGKLHQRQRRIGGVGGFADHRARWPAR